jgi:lipopolysaccharide export system protein LptA
MPNQTASIIRTRLLTPSWLLSAGVVALACFSAGLPAQAKQSDKQQALYATADALRVDDANGVSVFTGNVVITKGSIVIKG